MIPGGGTLDSQRLAGGRRLLPRVSSGTRAAAKGASPAGSGGFSPRAAAAVLSIPGLNLEVRLSALVLPLSGRGPHCELVKIPILFIFAVNKERESPVP